MELFELKREQLKLAHRISLQDAKNTCKTIGGATCVQAGDKLVACVVICDFPSFKILEKQTFILNDPLPYRAGFQAYREMPAVVDAYNKLAEEPDLLLVNGNGILHQRKIGIASHLGLVLNQPTIGVVEKLPCGQVENGKVLLQGEILGFEMKTREHAKPIYVSPGHLVSLGSTLQLLPKTIQYPHKLPEPLHLAHKFAKKLAKKIMEGKQ